MSRTEKWFTYIITFVLDRALQKKGYQHHHRWGSWGFLFVNPFIHMSSSGKYQILIQTQDVVRKCPFCLWLSLLKEFLSGLIKLSPCLKTLQLLCIFELHYFLRSWKAGVVITDETSFLSKPNSSNILIFFKYQPSRSLVPCLWEKLLQTSRSLCSCPCV